LSRFEIASLAGIVVGLTVSFVLSKLFAFGSPSWNRASSEAPRFLVFMPWAALRTRECAVNIHEPAFSATEGLSCVPIGSVGKKAVAEVVREALMRLVQGFAQRFLEKRLGAIYNGSPMRLTVELSILALFRC
jgi:hypothetical protein